MNILPSVKVGVAGLGAIGYGMAESLLRSQFNVTGYDVNTEAASRLREAGGHAVFSASEVGAASECCICVVATSDQARKLFLEPENGALWHLPPSSTIILGITAQPDFVSAFQQEIKDAGRSDISVIDCPVSGGEARARAGTLSLLCSGDQERIADVRPILQAIGSQTHEIPGGLGAASRIKFAHQILVGVNIVAAVEISALARASGLDLGNVHKQVMGSDAASWLFGQRVSHILDPKSVPASSLSIIVKDLVSMKSRREHIVLTAKSMISAYGRAHGLHLPMSLMAEQLFKFAASARWDMGDDTSLMNLYLSHEMNPGEKGPTSIEDIQTLLFGIHTAASVEAMSFAKDLHADWPSLASVVKTAAGASKAFEMLLNDTGIEQAPNRIASQNLSALGSKMVSPHLLAIIDQRLLTSFKSSIIDKISGYGPPLPMASVAIQILSSPR